jgi:excisionase family DNA binding protein
LSATFTDLSPRDAVSTDTFLTAKEAAQIARLHPVTLLRWAREGRVPHRRLSPRKIVFPLGQLKAWLESGYTGSTVRAA